MPSFEPQYWNGYKFKLHPSGFIRQYISYVYHYISVYFNGAYINFDLILGIPNNATLEPIIYEWELYDRKDKTAVKNGSGLIELSKEKSKIIAISNGKKLERMMGFDGYKYNAQLDLTKAIQLGYQVDDMKCYIKMKFTIGDKVFNSDPMAVFNIYEKDELHRVGIELFMGAVVGGIVAFILSRIFH